MAVDAGADHQGCDGNDRLKANWGSRMPDTDRPESRARARARADRYARLAGLAVGVVAASLWATMDITNSSHSSFDFGVPLVSFVTAFGLCAVGGVLLGDALTPRPREAVRTASLAPRRARDHVPPRITPLLSSRRYSSSRWWASEMPRPPKTPPTARTELWLSAAVTGPNHLSSSGPACSTATRSAALLPSAQSPAPGPCGVSLDVRATNSSTATARGRSPQHGGAGLGPAVARKF